LAAAAVHLAEAESVIPAAAYQRKGRCSRHLLVLVLPPLFPVALMLARAPAAQRLARH
jgi:hypothetical protein